MTWFVYYCVLLCSLLFCWKKLTIRYLYACAIIAYMYCMTCNCVLLILCIYKYHCTVDCIVILVTMYLLYYCDDVIYTFVLMSCKILYTYC